MPNPSSQGASAARKIGLSVALSLGLWLMGEAAVMALFPAELQSYEAPPTSPQQGAPNMLGNPYLLWEIAPGERREQSVTLRINSLGLRGPEPTMPKPAGVRRFATTGDSSVFGFGVEDDEVFSSVAAAQLGPGAEAINAAIPGYSSYQSLNLLRMRVMDLEPDLLVVANLWSDNNFDSFVDRDLLTHYRSYEESPIARARGLLARSAIFRLLDWKLRVEDTAVQIQKVGWMLGRDYQVGKRRVAIDDYARNLDTIVRLARKHDAEVLFLMLANEEDVPTPTGRQSFAWDPYRQVMRDAAARYGAPLLEVPPLFQDSGMTDGQLFLDQMHPTATGHRIIGEALADLLQDKGWLEGRPLMQGGTGDDVPDYSDPYVDGAPGSGDASGPSGGGFVSLAQGEAEGDGPPRVRGSLRFAGYSRGKLQVDAVDATDGGPQPRVLASVRLDGPGSFQLKVGDAAAVRLRVYVDEGDDGPTQDDKVHDLGVVQVADAQDGSLVVDLDTDRYERAR